MKRERERRGRIKTNPLGELVLVAMATIITSHLGEQEQGERGGGGGRGGEKGRKMGRRLGYEDAGRGKRRDFRSIGGVLKCQRGEEKCDRQRQGDNFPKPGPAPPPLPTSRKCSTSGSESQSKQTN